MRSTRSFSETGRARTRSPRPAWRSAPGTRSTRVPRRSTGTEANVGVPFRIRATSKPSVFGSETSMTTASGERDIRSSRTSSPVRASIGDAARIGKRLPGGDPVGSVVHDDEDRRSSRRSRTPGDTAGRDGRGRRRRGAGSRRRPWAGAGPGPCAGRRASRCRPAGRASRLGPRRRGRRGRIRPRATSPPPRLARRVAGSPPRPGPGRPRGRRRSGAVLPPLLERAVNGRAKPRRDVRVEGEVPGTGSEICFMAIPSAESAVNGRTPVSISKAMIPME